VPSIYTYRKPAIIAIISPFTVFTVVFAVLSVIMFQINTLYYLFSLILFGLHLGGCCGDLYLTILLLFKFKDNRLLMSDNGPEQHIYLPGVRS
jgi:hypothetical protein